MSHKDKNVEELKKVLENKNIKVPLANEIKGRIDIIQKDKQVNK